MTYRIMVYNRQALGAFDPKDMLTALKDVHYATLCRQYGLDPALIVPALAQLRLEVPVGEQVPYFLLRYQSEHQPPIIVSQWDVAQLSQFLASVEASGQVVPPAVKAHLDRVAAVYSVALEPEQLADLGLVLAYEIARWLAFRGAGFVLGLDSVWYRLNAHQAFIPLVETRHT